MITDIIVVASAAASAAFVVAWALRPDLRAWIERPKYHFLAAVREYDRAQPAAGDSKGSHSE
ncbi:MAG: hypothetical protein M3550_08750 [Actinomycetota bacterium]|nr:hypothetical protein [Actinomycetota bacterium]